MLVFFSCNFLSPQLESLQSEKEELTKLSESRLLEINQLTQHITELKQEVEKLKLASQQVGSDVCLCVCLSVMYHFSVPLFVLACSSCVATWIGI